MKYNPERWVMLKLDETIDGVVHTHYRILAGWYGGFTGADSWKINSGIEKVEEDGDFLIFYGSSGSEYRCHKEAYGMSNLMNGTFLYYEKQNNDSYNLSLVDQKDALTMKEFK